MLRADVVLGPEAMRRGFSFSRQNAVTQNLEYHPANALCSMPGHVGESDREIFFVAPPYPSLRPDVHPLTMRARPGCPAPAFSGTPDHAEERGWTSAPFFFSMVRLLQDFVHVHHRRVVQTMSIIVVASFLTL